MLAFSGFCCDVIYKGQIAIGSEGAVSVFDFPSLGNKGISSPPPAKAATGKRERLSITANMAVKISFYSSFMVSPVLVVKDAPFCPIRLLKIRLIQLYSSWCCGQEQLFPYFQAPFSAVPVHSVSLDTQQFFFGLGYFQKDFFSFLTHKFLLI